MTSERWLRSFGRRRGRKLSPRQAALLEDGLAKLSIDLSSPPPLTGLPQLFPAPVDEVWLEIGFGAGEHLVWQAVHHPRVGLIGAEPFVNGVVAMLSAAIEKQVSDRVRLHADDAVPLLGWLPPASLARAFLLFPDPWPKKRHRERRLFTPALLDKLARVLRPDAEFRFATDIADYAEQAEAHARQHPSFEIAQIFSSATRTIVADWPVTRYERKAERENRSATLLSLRRRTRPSWEAGKDPLKF